MAWKSVTVTRIPGASMGGASEPSLFELMGEWVHGGGERWYEDR